MIFGRLCIIRRISRLCGLAWHHIIAWAKNQYWMVITICQRQHGGLYYNPLYVCVCMFVSILHKAIRHLPISKHLIMLKFILSQPRLYFLSLHCDPRKKRNNGSGTYYSYSVLNSQVKGKYSSVVESITEPISENDPPGPHLLPHA